MTKRINGKLQNKVKILQIIQVPHIAQIQIP